MLRTTVVQLWDLCLVPIHYSCDAWKTRTKIELHTPMALMQDKANGHGNIYGARNSAYLLRAGSWLGAWHFRFDTRRRGVIDWNSAGKTLLTPHYQRLAWIRGTFPAFSTQTFIELSTGNVGFTVTHDHIIDQSGVVLENFSGSAQTANIMLVGSGGTANVYFNGGVVDGQNLLP